MPPLIVLDTGVVARALISKEEEGSSSYQIIRRAGTGTVRLAHSDEGLRELTRIVREKDAQGLIASASRAFEVAMDLWAHGSLYHPTRRDWPSIPDPDDGWMPDLAFDAGAEIIVTWDSHLLDHEIPFPVEVLKPPELLAKLNAAQPQ